MVSVAGIAIGCSDEAQQAPVTALTGENVGASSAALTTIPRHPACPLDPVLINPVTLHVAPPPLGKPTNSGSTAAAPLDSLASAQAKIPANFTTDYQILVHGGEYRAQTVVWNTVSASHRVQIVAAPNETPVFNGLEANATLTKLPWLLQLTVPDARADATTNFLVRGLTIQNYAEAGIILDGNGSDSSHPFTCATFADNTLLNIGDFYADCSNGLLTSCSQPGWGCACTGFAGFDVMGSSNNVFVNNKIINAIDTPDAQGLGGDAIHAFYLYAASGNIIKDNYIRANSGPPMKIRQDNSGSPGSSDNQFIDNYIERSGGTTARRNAFFYSQSTSDVSTNNLLSGNVLTFPYKSGFVNALASPTAPYTNLTAALDPKLYEGGWPTLETPTALTSADINNDGKDEIFVALYYPNEHFTKVVYSEGGSRELSEVAYTSSIWQVNHLVAGNFGGQGVTVIADFYDPSSGKTQVAGGSLDADGKYRLGTGNNLIKHDNSGGWRITAMAAGQVAGTSQPQLFSAFTSGGVAQIVRGDGFTNESGASHPGFDNDGVLYSSSQWQIPAMTTGKVDGSGTVKLVTAFFHPQTTVQSAIYIGSGSGPNSANDALLWSDPTDRVTSLTAGKFDGANERLITGIKSGGTGKIYAQVGTSPIDIKGTLLYSNSAWDIAGVARGEVNASGTGDEVIAAFDKSTATQIYVGDGVTSATNDGSDPLYRGP
ncbi:MAG TPA: right-handed parallel beta-helix repeat-containing protein [Candidatus Saccharimonadales bacterium]|nr:right-handed parallel beta-helix repeat-containing protein [Candidatus Saccharimonadales bacterium]